MSLWRVRANRCQLLRAAIPLSQAQVSGQVLASGSSCKITPVSWTRQSTYINSSVSGCLNYPASRILHTQLGARRKLVEEVKTYGRENAQDIALHPIDLTTAAAQTSAPDQDDLLTVEPYSSSSTTAEESSMTPEHPALDRIFVNPVLYVRRGSVTSATGMGLTVFFRQWFKDFSWISQDRLRLKASKSAAQRDPCLAFTKLLQEMHGPLKTGHTFSSSEVWATWSSLHPNRRHKFWIPALLYVLREDSRSAAELLLSFSDRDYEVIPSYAVGDAVALICGTLLPNIERGTSSEQEIEGSGDIELCLKVLARFLGRYEGVHQSGSLSRHTIGVVTRSLNGPQTEKWIKTLSESSHFLSPGDKLYLAIHATNQGKPVAALDVLRTIPSDLMGESYVSAACDRMLRTEISSENLGALRSQMLLVMLELGVRPDERMRDSLVAHAMETGDRDSAWNIHERALENGIKPSARTYIHLLDGIKDASGLNTLFSIYREARHYNLPHRSPQLGNALIRALHRALESNRRSFDTMLDMYADLFDLTPIQALGFESKKLKPPKAVKRMQPPLLTLQAMVIAGIKSCADLHKLTTIYARWIENIRTDSKMFAFYEYKAHVSRSFIVRFHQLGAKHMCSQVMDDFLDMQPRKSSIEKLEDLSHASAYAADDVKLWTSLLHSYSHDGKLEAAEQTLRQMKSHGVKPDAFTFEVLLWAYARNQNIPKAAEILREKHHAGYDLDEWTLRAIGEIKDRESLRENLEEESFMPA